ncbi:MAG: hypothetical protein GX774_07405 [Armatimonadetes bacterium]|nr:hypothetical protein [Armatimonadota bacterium]
MAHSREEDQDRGRHRRWRRWARLVLGALALAAALVCPAGGYAAPELRRIKVEGITLTYPVELEAEAQAVARQIPDTLVPARETCLRVRRAFVGGTAARAIGKRLGCSLSGATPRAWASALGGVADAAASPFERVRLFSESEVQAAGGLQPGGLTVTRKMGRDTLTFTLSWGTRRPLAGQRPEKRPILAIVAGTDLSPYREFAKTLPALFFHEMAEFALVAEKVTGYAFYYPSSRWFNEGVATWVALQVVEDLMPDLSEACRAALLPDEGETALRNDVNLLTWRQNSYQDSPDPWVSSPEVIRAHYLCAAETVERILRGQPPGTLPAVLGRLKKEEVPDNRTICRVVREVTGVDALAILREYSNVWPAVTRVLVPDAWDLKDAPSPP